MFPAGLPRNEYSRRWTKRARNWQRWRRRMVHTRNAILTDVEQIHAIMEPYYPDGTLLPRHVPELCENIRDFVVAEERGRIIGCGALHLYGLHLAEIRSIAVDQTAQGRGAGRLLVKALLEEAERHNVTCVCL